MIFSVFSRVSLAASAMARAFASEDAPAFRTRLLAKFPTAEDVELDFDEEELPELATTAEAPASRAPAPRDSVAETPARAPAPDNAAGLTFTLEAHLAGDTWVVFQQEDPQAPELGRYTGALAASLLTVFGAAPERPRRFYCPLTKQPMSAGEATQALTAFFAGLSRQHGGRRALFCVDHSLATAVLGGERFQAVKLGEMPALAVDSLQEMLDRPALAKKRSWQAMVAHGFAGSRG